MESIELPCPDSCRKRTPISAANRSPSVILNPKTEVCPAGSQIQRTDPEDHRVLEKRGKADSKEDDHERTGMPISCVSEKEKLFATFLTPADQGSGDRR